jgi:hypothetical protein
MHRENLRQIGHNQSMRIIGYRGLCSRAAFLAMLCSLAMTASASAEAPAGPIGEGSEAPIEQGVEGVPAGSSGPGPEPEAAEGEVAGESTEGSTEVGGGQATEGASEGSSESTTGAGGEESAESTPPAEEISTETPATAVPEETSEPAPVAIEPVPVAVEEGSLEVVTTPLAGSGEEDLTGASSTSARASSDTGFSGGAASRPDSTSTATQGSTAALAIGLALPLAGPTADRAEAQASAAVSPTATGGRRAQGAMTASQRAGDLSCELATLGGSATDNCAAGWLGGKRFLAADPTDFDPGGDSLAATTSGGPPGDGHGGAAAGGAPVSPAPGPAPSGASGAAVGGASGVAPSAFLSLAGLLLLAAPRALRRLRLSCRPWLPACFVLIPERPG